MADLVAINLLIRRSVSRVWNFEKKYRQGDVWGGQLQGGRREIRTGEDWTSLSYSNSLPKGGEWLENHGYRYQCTEAEGYRPRRKKISKLRAGDPIANCLKSVVRSTGYSKASGNPKRLKAGKW